MKKDKQPETRKQRSPATDRKLSDRASEYALLQYLSTLAKSKKLVKTFDFSFVEYLLENGADINNKDVTGQTAFHIASKFWNVDVARFLLDNGADINAQDSLGRSPLHEASALNYVDMVEFLLQNGADYDIQTFEQEQRPIHFAAKNDSSESLRVLLAYGADINSLDATNRTPLQVAAEMNRTNVTEMLINEGASVMIYDTSGNSSLTLLAEKLPNIALMALDQLHSVDRVKRKEYFSLNYLEGSRINEYGHSTARTLLEVAVRRRRYQIVMHPVVQELVDVKWNYYGRRGAIWDLSYNLVYVVLWTMFSCSLTSRSAHVYNPMEKNGWKIPLVLLIVVTAAAEMRKHFKDTILTRRLEKTWVEWRAQALEDELAFCHPRCPEERNYLRKQVKSLRNHSYRNLVGDGWAYMEWISLVLIVVSLISHVVFLLQDTTTTYKIHSIILILLLLILWLRMAKFTRPFRFTGPIVVIFSHIVKDVTKCTFLFVMLFIPYASAFWLTFGPNSPVPVEGYNNIFALTYNMLCMVVGIDFPFDDLLLANAFMARILCSSFIVSTAIVVVNLLIALLSDTFTRLYSNAVANAMMQRAQSVVLTARTLSKTKKRDYNKYIREHCSPLVKSLDRDIDDELELSNMDVLGREIKKINIALSKSQNSGPIKSEPGSKTGDIHNMKYMLNQLLKQSSQNASKLTRMNTLLTEFKRKNTSSNERMYQSRQLFARRDSVLSGVSGKTEVLECLELNEIVIPAAETFCDYMETPSSTLSSVNYREMSFASGLGRRKSSKKARFDLATAAVNDGFIEDDAQSPDVTSHEQRPPHRSGVLAVSRGSTSTTTLMRGVPSRLFDLDRLSSDGSISL